MALVVNDRVKETSTTTGTGTFDLAGAVSGFESFVAGHTRPIFDKRFATFALTSTATTTLFVPFVWVLYLEAVAPCR